MTLLLLAMGFFVAGALLALAFRGSPAWAARLSGGATVTGCVLGLVPAFGILAGGAESLQIPWFAPYGSFHIALDPLSGVFLLPIFIVSGLAAVYGVGYLRPVEGRSRAGSWFFFNLLVASMALVVTARNAVLFLTAWEVMALTSFFLVTHEHESAAVRDAGVVYLIAAHLGTAFLLVMFLLLGRSAGSLEFDRFAEAASFSAPAAAGILFMLAVVGFGAKAGFMPLHVWLPEAHPVAPSHVSAVMSGVMIKMGIYGLIRTLTFLGPPPAWWGWTLLAIGLTSGVGGVLFALAQHDLKRLLAYHSVENIGIITLGLGVGVLGQHAGNATIAVLGYAGAMLHVLNHALFKSLLFLCAGAVQHAAHTLHIEELGGLLRRMPRTGFLFLVGAVAISGLPPLNGFISEFLIYLGAFRGVLSLDAGNATALAAAIGGLAFIGCLAVACFTKAFGIVFLGSPRSRHAAEAREAGRFLVGPMAALAALCAAVAGLATLIVPMFAPAVAQVTGLDAAAALGAAAHPLGGVVLASAAFLALVSFLAFLRNRLLSKRTVEIAPTWDCGYARPTPRMQYTASSFAEPITRLFHAVLRTRRLITLPAGFFPKEASLATETPDLARIALYRPSFEALEWFTLRLRWLQSGRVQIYVVYIMITLVVVLIATVGR